MDYTSQNLLFKISKGARYLRLYGPSRTYWKVRGQYHMKKAYKDLPGIRDDSSTQKHVGLLGCGNFSYSTIAYYLKKNYGRVIKGAMDIDIDRAASLFESYDLSYYTNEANRIIQDDDIDLIYIASNHASHAEYAVEALNAGKNVHIEKPHVVSKEQLVKLCRAMQSTKGKVSLGFNRPYSRIGSLIRTALDSQDGAGMYNWFVAGHEIDPDHWYFHEREGGRVLGNLCHWTDFIYHLVPAERRYPITINPTRGHKSDCDIAVTYLFGDETLAVITFSAKGHTFEGVRERFSAHKGDILISMDDFASLVIENVASKKNYSSFFRDHGHEYAIKYSYETTRSKDAPGRSIEYTWETGDLFLQTRQALEEGRSIVVHPFSSDVLA